MATNSQVAYMAFTIDFFWESSLPRPSDKAIIGNEEKSLSKVLH